MGLGGWEGVRFQTSGQRKTRRSKRNTAAASNRGVEGKIGGGGGRGGGGGGGGGREGGWREKHRGRGYIKHCIMHCIQINYDLFLCDVYILFGLNVVCSPGSPM